MRFATQLDSASYKTNEKDIIIAAQNSASSMSNKDRWKIVPRSYLPTPVSRKHCPSRPPSLDNKMHRQNCIAIPVYLKSHIWNSGNSFDVSKCNCQYTAFRRQTPRQSLLIELQLYAQGKWGSRGVPQLWPRQQGCNAYNWRSLDVPDEILLL